MASTREVFEVAQAAADWRRDRLAMLPPGATSLDPTPAYAHKEQVLWCEPVQGRDRFYCHDDRARLRWRVTPKDCHPTVWAMKLPVTGGWVLRPSNRVLSFRNLVFKLPENAL